MTSETFRVVSISVDGEVLSGVEVGTAKLQVIGPMPDFVLDFRTPNGHVLPARQTALEVVVADGRTYRANGINAMPNPWSHRYTNGLGVPGWKEP